MTEGFRRFQNVLVGARADQAAAGAGAGAGAGADLNQLL